MATRVRKSECMVETGMSWYCRFDSVEMWRPWISPEIILRKVEQPEPGQTKTRHISPLLTNPSKSINIRISNFPLPPEHYPDNRQSSGTLPTVFWWSVEEPNPWRMEKDTPLTSEFVDGACRLLMGWQFRFLWIVRSKVVLNLYTSPRPSNSSSTDGFSTTIHCLPVPSPVANTPFALVCVATGIVNM